MDKVTPQSLTELLQTYLDTEQALNTYDMEYSRHKQQYEHLLKNGGRGTNNNFSVLEAPAVINKYYELLVFEAQKEELLTEKERLAQTIKDFITALDNRPIVGRFLIRMQDALNTTHEKDYIFRVEDNQLQYSDYKHTSN